MVSSNRSDVCVAEQLLAMMKQAAPSCTNVFSLCSHCCLYSHDGG